MGDPASNNLRGRPWAASCALALGALPHAACLAEAGAAGVFHGASALGGGVSAQAGLAVTSRVDVTAGGLWLAGSPRPWRARAEALGALRRPSPWTAPWGVDLSARVGAAWGATDGADVELGLGLRVPFSAARPRPPWVDQSVVVWSWALVPQIAYGVRVPADGAPVAHELWFSFAFRLRTSTALLP